MTFRTESLLRAQQSVCFLSCWFLQAFFLSAQLNLTMYQFVFRLDASFFFYSPFQKVVGRGAVEFDRFGIQFQCLLIILLNEGLVGFCVVVCCGSHTSCLSSEREVRSGQVLFHAALNFRETCHVISPFLYGHMAVGKTLRPKQIAGVFTLLLF